MPRRAVFGVREDAGRERVFSGPRVRRCHCYEYRSWCLPERATAQLRQLKRRFGRPQGRTGVGGSVHGGQTLGGDPGVDVRGGEAAVPEQLLDVADIRSALQHQGGG